MNEWVQKDSKSRECAVKDFEGNEKRDMVDVML